MWVNGSVYSVVRAFGSDPCVVKDFLHSHRRTVWVGGIASGMFLVLLLFLLLVDWNVFRPMIARTITARTGRPASIDGDLKVHLWSWSPSAEINGLRIENPYWADRSLMFGARRITVGISLPRLLRGQIVIPRIDLLEPQANLERDSGGRASWESATKEGTPNHGGEPAKLPTVQSMTIEKGKLRVIDKIRKLKFVGSLVAAEQVGNPNDSAFQLRSTGSLNGKPFRLEADGGPLFVLEPNKPYSFAARITASDINLNARVTVLKPFDLGLVDVKFAVSGDDLADVFYLTGLALPNSPKYRITGTMHVDKTRYTIDDLRGRLGASDVSGHVQIQAAGVRPKLTGKLSSATLNAADLASSLGHGAAGEKSLSSSDAARTYSQTERRKFDAHAPGADAPGADAPKQENDRLFPDSELQLSRVRGMDADVTYEAASVVASAVPMKHVSLHLTLQNGLLRLDPLAFILDQGKFHGAVQIDARTDVPVSDINMRLDDVELAQFKPAAAKQAPLQGVLLGRFDLHGDGSSIHKFASNSTGSLSMVIPRGQMNETIAELMGIDVVRGLGLLLSKKQPQTDIRCGVIDFKDQHGHVNTTTVYVDTSNVLITGRGTVNLGTESLDLALQGDPKKLRLLRIRAPISIHGTLLHPAIGVKPEKLAGQAGIAAALATLLTPVAAVLALIDPGLAKDKDCSTVLEQATAGVRN
jgi:AsmA family protein